MFFDENFLHRLETLTLISRQAQIGQWQGERRSLKRGQSVEFADYRNYVPGDDFRLVDWNAYARLERFFLKLFVEEEEQIVHFLIDSSLSMDWPSNEPQATTNKFIYAQKATAALGYIALAGLDRITVTSMGAKTPHQLPLIRSRHKAKALFDFLAKLKADGTTDLNKAFKHYATHNKKAGPLIIFSDLFDNPQQNNQSTQPLWATGLNLLLARRFDITLIHLLSPDEVDPPINGDLRLLDSETGQAVEVTADSQSLARYKAGLTAWQQSLKTWCNQRNVVYLPVTTDVAFERLIFTFLRQRKVLK